MLKIKFSEKNTIFVILNKNKKNINFNLGEYLNSNTKSTTVNPRKERPRSDA